MTLLQPLRHDLEWNEGPTDRNGEPTLILHDPRENTYLKIGWHERQILERLREPVPLEALLSSLQQETALRQTEEEILTFYKQLAMSGLIEGASPDPVALAGKKQVPLWSRFSKILFFRIPLIRPDGFLARQIDTVRLLGSRGAWMIYLITWLFGLYGLTQQWALYSSTFLHLFNWRGALAYSMAIVAIKVVHEFAHGFTAKHYGLKVPQMGIALIVLWPLAFCDVTDGWRLDTRKKRLNIHLAGVLAELVVGGIALAVWTVTSPGIVQSIAFLLSSATVLSTVLINLNPAMRFDGYYVLADLWQMDNLQPRAFAWIRWQFHSRFLGLPGERPEAFSRAEGGLLSLYAIYVVLYRIGLYTGIAVMVYFKFTKLVGLLLFACEMWAFLVLPAYREGLLVWGRRAEIRPQPRAWLAAASLLLIAGWFCLPLQRTLLIPAITQPQAIQMVCAPFSGEIGEILVSDGGLVEAGTPLVRLNSPTLAADLAELHHERVIRRNRFVATYLAGDQRHQWEMARKEWARTEQAYLAKLSEQKEGRILASFTGRAYGFKRHLKKGQSVGKGALLGRIADPSQTRVLGFLPEEYVAEMREEDEVLYYPTRGEERYRGRIVRLQACREDQLDWVVLSSLAQGELPVKRHPDGTLRLQQSFFLVEVDLLCHTGDIPLGETGALRMITRRRSLLYDSIKAAWRVLRRESIF